MLGQGAAIASLQGSWLLARARPEYLGQARTDRARLPAPKLSPVPLNGVYLGAATQGECQGKCVH